MPGQNKMVRHRVGGAPVTTALQLIHDGALTAGVAGALYTGTVTVIALASVFAPRREQRLAARETLKVLLRQRPRVRG